MLTTATRPALMVLALLALLSLPPGVIAQDTQSATRAPVLLVASPQLRDLSFAQTVVLVAFPAGSGPIGVILNRPTSHTLGKLFPDDPRLKRRTDPVSFGGPVRLEALMFLYRFEHETQGALGVLEDLYLSGNAEILSGLLQRPGSAFTRYYLGYAGWAPGQLEAEIALGGWYVLPADIETIVNADPRRIWKQLLLRATAVRT